MLSATPTQPKEVCLTEPFSPKNIEHLAHIVIDRLFGLNGHPAEWFDLFNSLIRPDVLHDLGGGLKLEIIDPQITEMHLENQVVDISYLSEEQKIQTKELKVKVGHLHFKSSLKIKISHNVFGRTLQYFSAHIHLTASNAIFQSHYKITPYHDVLTEPTTALLPSIVMKPSDLHIEFSQTSIKGLLNKVTGVVKEWFLEKALHGIAGDVAAYTCQMFDSEMQKCVSNYQEQQQE